MENQTENIEILPIEVKEVKDIKAIVKEYNKQYYATNRIKSLAYMGTKVNCDVCNCIISRGKKSLHNASKKHATNLRIAELEERVKAI